MTTPAKAIDRHVITRGSAVIKFAGATFFSEADVTLKFAPQLGEVQSDAYGKLFDFTEDMKPTLSFKPVGEIEALDVLFPFASMSAGQSILGSSDTPLEIIPMDTNQPKVVFHNCAVKNPPPLKLAGNTVAFNGDVEFAIARKNNALPQAEDAFYQELPNDWDGTGLDVSKIFIQSYNCRWLSAGTWYAFIGTPQSSGTLTTGKRYRIASHRLGDKFTNVGAVPVATNSMPSAFLTAPTAWTQGSVLLDITGQTSGSLVSGKRYRIESFATGDDFTNVGAASNATGSVFTASGTAPTDWTNGSELIEITADIAWSADAATVQTAINALNTLGGETLTVSGDVEAGWALTHDADSAQDWITGRVTGMPGGTKVRYDLATQGDTGVAQVATLHLYPWNNFPSRDGIEISFDVTISEDMADSTGTYDYIFEDLAVSAKMIPMNVSQSDLLEAVPIQGLQATRGRRIAATAHDLVIKSTAEGQDFYVKITGANLIEEPGLVYSRKNQRIPQLGWRASRTVSGGSPDPLYAISTTIPAIS